MRAGCAQIALCVSCGVSYNSAVVWRTEPRTLPVLVKRSAVSATTVKSVVSEGGIEEVIYQDTISPTAMGARKPGKDPIVFEMPMMIPNEKKRWNVAGANAKFCDKPAKRGVKSKWLT